MTPDRRAMGHQGRRAAIAGAAAVLAVLLSVLLLAESGLFSPLGSAGAVKSALPGMTLDNDGGTRRLVVTSVRSDGQAQRAGIRAGDEIESVDGLVVHNVAALRAFLLADHRPGPLSLHLRRGDALWTVAIDRTEPAITRIAATETANVPENSSH